jgi:hypothetical protein
MALFLVALEIQAIYISLFLLYGKTQQSTKFSNIAYLHHNCCFGQQNFDRNKSLSCSISIEGSDNGTRNLLFQQLRVNSWEETAAQHLHLDLQREYQSVLCDALPNHKSTIKRAKAAGRNHFICL